MKVLAIDTASSVATVAVVSDEKLLGEVMVNSPKTHSQKLMPMIESLLDQLDMSVADMDGVAVTEGPGSFTGLRIGLATAKAFAHAHGLPVASISGLEGLANNVSFYEGLICPIMDARRQQVYTAVYKNVNGELEALETSCNILIDELIDRLAERDEPVMFLGDGIYTFKEIIQSRLGDRAHFAPVHLSMQMASSVGALGLKKFANDFGIGYSEVKAEYLRKTEAERNHEARSK